MLVHCKMGVSRSASVVIAYAMKAFDWDFHQAMKHVKEKRNCIKPNTSFLSQLETYQGILDAMKNKEKLQRSKSETNLKSPGLVSKTDSRIMEPTPLIQALSGRCRGRPRSWSPDTRLASHLLPPTSVSLENLAQETRNVLMPCANGSYSVSQNQIMRLREDGIPSVKHIVNELESHVAATERRSQRERRNLKLNLAHHIDALKCDANLDLGEKLQDKSSECSDSNFHYEAINTELVRNVVQTIDITDKTETWDPGEKNIEDKELTVSDNCDIKDSNEIVKCDSGICTVDVRAKPRQLTGADPFSKQLDRVFDKEERRQGEGEGGPPPSRQGSWSSCDSAVVLDRPSRHSSWGSYDTRPSRNSSWGSYDEPWNMGTVKRTKQKLEEGSAKKPCPDADPAPCEINEAINMVLTHKLLVPPCDLDIINENHEHSCATSNKNLKIANGFSVSVPDNLKKNNKMSAIIKELDFNNSGDALCNVPRRNVNLYSPLSASAPATSGIHLLECPLSRPCSTSAGNLFSRHGDFSNPSIVKAFPTQKHKTNDFKMDKNTLTNRTLSGKVKNLKMEFEAKSIMNNETKNNTLNVEAVIQNINNSENNTKSKGRSLPSSPVSVHVDKKQAEPEPSSPAVGQTTSLEDLSVKVLVGKYDRPKSQQLSGKTNFGEPPIPVRQSSLKRDIDNKAERKQSTPGCKNSVFAVPKGAGVTLRPPVAPTVLAMAPMSFPKAVVASVVAKAQKKQLQHGKTHPLARLKNHTTTRCTNPVYNTM